MVSYSGKQKIEFCKRLGNNWQDLADYFDISDFLRKQYAQGKEAREIWTWLEQTEKLDELEPPFLLDRSTEATCL